MLAEMAVGQFSAQSRGLLEEGAGRFRNIGVRNGAGSEYQPQLRMSFQILLDAQN